MKNLLALIGAAVVVFLAAGWYLGWYEVSREKNEKGSLQLDIKPDRVGEDLGALADRATDAVKAVRDNRAKEDRPAPLTTPAGPVDNFFKPSSGWRPIETPTTAPESKSGEDRGIFGIRLPRR